MSAKGQNDPQWGAWNIVNAEYEFAKNFIGYFELQARSQTMFNRYFYYETKGGVTYKINKNFKAFVGGGRYNTFKTEQNFHDKIQTELRVWEQFIITQSLNRLKFEHRYRAEQALINQKYRNRFRYRFNVIVPVNKSKVEPKTFFVSVGDELFLTHKAPFFMRNRFFAGFGYQVNSFLTLQTTWVNQYNYTLISGGAKNFWQIAVNFRFMRSDNTFEHIPAQRD